MILKAFVKQSEKPDDIALANVPLPEIDEDELLVEIKSIGVGIHDGYFLPSKISYPYVIGIEAAGVVSETGARVTEYEPGDRIAFISAMHPKGGTWAEYAVVKKDSLIIRMPDNLEYVQAAALPVAANTILRAFSVLSLQHGDSLFIAGASGAIGTLAIQLAKIKGLKVAGSASKKNHSYMQSLGADNTVDYYDADWISQICTWEPNGVDAAIAIQPGTSEDCLDTIKDGGSLVSISGESVVPKRGIKTMVVPHDVSIEQQLVEFMNLVAIHEIQPVIEAAYPFESGLDALMKARSRRARGKSVLIV